jgi:hypothetical protein
MKRSNKKNQGSSFTTRRGLLLSFYIAAFIALIFVLVYYSYVLPMQKSFRLSDRRSPMLPFALYFVTAVVTGFHAYVLLSFVVYGVPLNPLELVSFLGSLCLFIAAYVSLFRPRAAARVALIACLAMWCFYAPALANLVRAKFARPKATSQLASPGPRMGQDVLPAFDNACL